MASVLKDGIKRAKELAKGASGELEELLSGAVPEEVSVSEASARLAQFLDVAPVEATESPVEEAAPPSRFRHDSQFEAVESVDVLAEEPLVEIYEEDTDVGLIPDSGTSGVTIEVDEEEVGEVLAELSAEADAKSVDIDFDEDEPEIEMQGDGSSETENSTDEFPEFVDDDDDEFGFDDEEADGKTNIFKGQDLTAFIRKKKK